MKQLIKLLIIILINLICISFCLGKTSENKWSKVNDFLYQLQNIDLEKIGKSKFDLVIIDYSIDGSEDGRFSCDEIKKLKNSPGGPKIVLAYMSIGEADDFRWYFCPNWLDKSGKFSKDAPSWLGPGNKDWPGAYKVKYWDPSWQKIIYGTPQSYLDKIIDAGFDGVYLDIVDAYYFWGPEGESGLKRETAELEMVDFVKKISNYARVTKGISNFGVFPQNAEELSKYPDYVAAVTGIGRESTWFFNNKLRPVMETHLILKDLDVFKKAGKLVLCTDYIVSPGKIKIFYEKARQKGYVPYATVRLLDKLTVNKGFAPD